MPDLCPACKERPIAESISIATARKLLLAVQSLDHLPEKSAGKRDVLALIRRMGYLQIDTIHVVARSPYLVLWSRLGNYPQEWVEELLAEKALFEYWSHAMCFLPVEDYPLYRRQMLDMIRSNKWPVGWAVTWVEEHAAEVEAMLNRIRETGAVRSAEFVNKDRKPGGWWNWKDEKNTLEALFLTGELMIARRKNFQRFYDLRERIRPGWDDGEAPSAAEVERTQLLRSVKALGVALPNWAADHFRFPKKSTAATLQVLASEGLLREIRIEGLKGAAYIHPENLCLLDQAASGATESTLTSLLSPFDPLVCDRQRARQLFDFDYTIECYTPASKRRYGYFTMPILHRGRLVGRLDPKAHRLQKTFEIKTLHLEPGIQITDQLLIDLAAALHRLADWHGTPNVVISQSDPPALAALLRAVL